jgi:hypothetical protein
VLGIELPVAFEVQVALGVRVDVKHVAELRSDADRARNEVADPVARAAVAGELLVDVAHHPHLPLLGQELAGGPVEVHVDAVSCR